MGNWEQLFTNLPYSMALTFNPHKGEGWTESIIAVMIVLTFCLTTIMYNGEVSSTVAGMIGMIMGFYFGHQNKKYIKK